MPKSEKGHNSVYFSKNFMKCSSGHLYHVPKLYAWYPDPSSNGSPDISFTMLHYKCQSWKREIIQSNIYKILPKVNQVIYTLDTIYEPNIMILAPGVLKIFCSQCPLWVQCLIPKRGIIQSNYDRILWKVNQVIYTMYPYMPSIMILAWTVLQIFCSQGCFTTQNAKVGKGK